MLRVVFAFSLLVFSLVTVEANAFGPKVIRQFCESLFGHGRVRLAVEFEATATEQLEAHVGPREAEYIGRHILEYPDLYLNAYRANKVSPVTRAMNSPRLAQVFFAAHPFNGLLAHDFMPIAAGASPESYQDAIEGAMRTVVTTPAEQLHRLFPTFDVAKDQARALDLCRWIGVKDEAVIAAAFSFLDPSLTRFKRTSKLGALKTRAYTAADFIHRLTRDAFVSKERVEWLVANALNLGHPFRTSYWTALVPETLDPGQLERLAHAWASPVLIESERVVLRRNAGGLIHQLESFIRRSPRKFRSLR